jgi:hypothetical protein
MAAPLDDLSERTRSCDAACLYGFHMNRWHSGYLSLRSAVMSDYEQISPRESVPSDPESGKPRQHPPAGQESAGGHGGHTAKTLRTGESSYSHRVLAVPAAPRDGHRLSIEFRITLPGDDLTPPSRNRSHHRRCQRTKATRPRQQRLALASSTAHRGTEPATENP